MINLRQNNLDLLRLSLASIVFFYHACYLPATPGLTGISAIIPADLAVKGFFVISGFLVFMSYERAGTISEYFARRVRRLYPGYAVVVIISALGLGLVSELPVNQYFAGGFWRYLAANLSFLNFTGPTLPGVFADNFLQTVNGSLWTLKIEVMFYLIVPVLAWSFRKTGPLPALVALYLFSLLYRHGLDQLATDPEAIMIRLSRQLPGQLAYFVTGIGFYLYRREAGRHLGLKLFLSAVAVVMIEQYAGIWLFEPLALGLIIIHLAFYRPLAVNASRFGDLSYGVYIVHFPLVQLLIRYGFLKDHPLTGMLLATTLVYGAAFALWHLVEKRFLRQSSHYLTPPEPAPTEPEKLSIWGNQS